MKWTPLGIVESVRTVGDKTINSTDEITVSRSHDKDYQIFKTYHTYTRHRIEEAFLQYENEKRKRDEKRKQERQEAIEKTNTVILVPSDVRHRAVCANCSAIIGYTTQDIDFQGIYPRSMDARGIICKSCGSFIRVGR